mgnify:CR=1 FL=1
MMVGTNPDSVGPRDEARPECLRRPHLLLGGLRVPHVDISRLRNVVLAGHAGSGKTTIAEHLLHRAGVINRMGSVNDGTASLDFEPEEQKRQLSLSLAANTFDRDGSHVTLIDTPGAYPGVGAEERGQSEAIARNLLEMADLEVPVVVVVTGEGGSGGALALEQQVDPRRHDHAAERGRHRQPGLFDRGQLANHHFAFDLEADDEEENDHQAVIDPVVE